MTGALSILASFVVALIGFAQSNKAKPDSRGYFGLTKTGLTLIIVSLVGVVFGTIKEIQSEADFSRLLTKLDNISRFAVEESEAFSGSEARTLRELGDEISAIATKSRGSDFLRSQFQGSRFAQSQFQGSDFAWSSFQGANFFGSQFQGANLRNSQFDDADFCGANLGKAIICKNTVLPAR